jgi:hypothetical protein
MKNEDMTQVAEVVYLLPQSWCLQISLTIFYGIEYLLDGKKIT